MIKIEIIGTKNSFKSLIIKGHANSAPYGEDLVCAAVSAVITGGFNSLFNPKDFDIKLDEGHAYLKANRPISEEDQIVIHTIITSLETIASSNEAFVKIKNI